MLESRVCVCACVQSVAGRAAFNNTRAACVFLHSVTHSSLDGARYLPDWIKDLTEERPSWIGPEISL